RNSHNSLQSSLESAWLLRPCPKLLRKDCAGQVQNCSGHPAPEGGRVMVSIEERTTGLNRLIRGELSAVETYRQALDKMKEAPDATELHALMVEHRSAVQALREHVIQHGGTPATSSGPWGAWAKFVEGAAQLF